MHMQMQEHKERKRDRNDLEATNLFLVMEVSQQKREKT
jgi:hypothetical protein